MAEASSVLGPILLVHEGRLALAPLEHPAQGIERFGGTTFGQVKLHQVEPGIRDGAGDEPLGGLQQQLLGFVDVQHAEGSLGGVGEGRRPAVADLALEARRRQAGRVPLLAELLLGLDRTQRGAG